MVTMNPGIECGSIAREVFKPDPKLLSLLQAAFRVEVRTDGTVDLGAGGEAMFHRAARKAFGIGAKGSRCPSHEHGVFFARFRRREKLKRRPDLRRISP